MEEYQVSASAQLAIAKQVILNVYQQTGKEQRVAFALEVEMINKQANQFVSVIQIQQVK